MIEVTGINGEMIIWGSLLVFSIYYTIKTHREHEKEKAANVAASAKPPEAPAPRSPD